MRTFIAVLTAAGALAFAAPALAAFPGHNGRVVFQAEVGGFNQLFDMRPDGSSLRGLSNNALYDFKPSYSPDGRRIAFSRMPSPTADNFAELWVMDADGSHQQRVTFNDRPDYDSAFSPDGRHLVFARRATAGVPSDIWTVDLRTGRERQLTNSPQAEDDRPQWSPDGTRIAFGSDADLYTIRPDGQDLRRLTRSPRFEAFPNYSPDGRLLTFTAESAGVIDVFVMPAGGGPERQLTFDPGEEGLSVFSPDGRFIAYTSDLEGRYDVMRIRADGSQRVNLTASSPAGGGDPDWQPMPR